ncbi:MAG: RnfABCDGE type electron transport complex subunit B [Xanthomonadaceae bacterium]|nr:RnfABCDGE type electron transport complex subunit B [Xanthomonadaceae bacterium]
MPFQDKTLPSPSRDKLLERLDRVLPQTQCGQCGYANCLLYAEAMSRREVDTDRCPPGGDEGAKALAWILGVPAIPYDRSRGEQKPAGTVAAIIEDDCIGCTKCIQICPTDSIVGGLKHMHTVVDPLCTGCALCVAICPMDCIIMQLPPASNNARVD